MSNYEVPLCEISTIEDIENIPDFETAKKFMKKWKIGTKGIKTKDEAITKLTEFWRTRELASVFQEEETHNRSEIQKIKNDVEVTKVALHDVLVKVRDRDEKLHLLEKKAQNVHQMSKQFKKISFRARAKRCWCQQKSVIIITFAVAVVVTSMIIIIAKGK